MFLKFLDSYIKITFESDRESTTKKNIRRFYGNYIVQKSTREIPAYSLYVYDNYKYSFLRKDGKAFISFFEKKGSHIDLPNTVDSIQLDLLMRILIHDLARKKNMFILHTSSVLVNGKARIFIGRNGIGKSTIVKMLKKEFKPLCDDKIILKKEHGALYLYQVPYRETNNYPKSDTAYPVAGFYVLRQDNDMRVRRINLLEEHDFISRVCSEFCVDNNRKEITDLVFSLKDNLFELSFTKRSKRKLIDFFNTLQ